MFNSFMPTNPCPHFIYPVNFRILNAAPHLGAINVRVNNRPIADNLSFGGIADRNRALPGLLMLKIFNARPDQSSDPLAERTLFIRPGEAFTLAIIPSGRGDDKLDVEKLQDGQITLTPGRAYFKFNNLSPDLRMLDLRLENGRTLFENVRYRESTNYRAALPGHYNPTLCESQSSRKLLNAPRIQLQPNTVYSYYALGVAEGEPRLRTLLVSERVVYRPY